MTRRRKKEEPVAEEIFTVDLDNLEDFETVCNVCEAEFLDGEDLKMHIAQVHSSPLEVTCKLCGIGLSGSEEFVSHFIFSHLEKSAFCFYCYRVYPDPVLRQHHESKHCAVEGSMVCSQCTTFFTNKLDLIKHELEHGDSEGVMLFGYFSLLSSALNMKVVRFLDNMCKNKSLVCRYCKHHSSHVSDYVSHLKASKCRSLACDNCFNVYTKITSIRYHFAYQKCNIAKMKKLRETKCSKCDNTFDLISFRSHKNVCNVLKCGACSTVFESLSELTEHRNKVHEARIPLNTCKFCKKEFVGVSSLKKHMMRSHKNKKQYKYNCVHCDSLFTHPSKLFGHYYTQHRDIKPYTCKICNIRFKLRKHFTIHIKLKHKSIGFVEFDKDSHVIFTAKKSENLINRQAMDMESTTDASDTDCNKAPAKNTRKRKIQASKKNYSTRKHNNLNTNSSAALCDNASDKINASDTKEASSIRVEIEQVDKESENSMVKPTNTDASDSSDEPLSKIKETLLTENKRKLRRRNAAFDQRAKLTCKICQKYCYTLQNFHHHVTLHEKTRLKKCMKCGEFFKSKKKLQDHIESNHSSSKLIETLKSLMEKRNKFKPPEIFTPFRSILEKRKQHQLSLVQNTTTNKFLKTIKKVHIVNDCTATLTPLSDHSLSVKNYIENFRPEKDHVSISNSVTIKAISTPVNREPLIKMRAFNPDISESPATTLRFPVKYKEDASTTDTKISVKLVQQLITKPSAVNMNYSEKIPSLQEKQDSEDYCNTFADETDYTQYKTESIPEVAQEVMLEDLEDIPRTKRLAQEIMLPNIAEEHGEVRIGHLLPQAPFFKIVKVKKLIKDPKEESPIPHQEVELPDGTRLVSVKNPYSHLIPNDHLQKILKANKSKYYTPKKKDIEKAIAKALEQVKPPAKRGRKRIRNNP